MTTEKSAQDILYPSVELEVLKPTNLQTNEENKLALEPPPVREISCPKCGNRDCWKRGNREGGRKEYSCKECQEFFIVYPLVDEGREIKYSNCDSRNYVLKGQYKKKQIYKCKDCHYKFVLNPLDRDNFNDINCRWCGSKSFARFGLSKAGKQQCICKDCHKQFTVGAERPDVLVAPEEFDFNRDVWAAKHLGYENGIHKHYKLNFEYIEQPWLKHYFKKFIFYLSSTRLAFSTLIGKFGYINVFSRFLKTISYNQEFTEIDRELMLQYFAYLKTNKYSYSQHTHCISTLKTFFETEILNHWFNVELALIRPEDWLKKPKTLPRFILEEVMK
jgi:transposase-like protein